MDDTDSDADAPSNQGTYLNLITALEQCHICPFRWSMIIASVRILIREGLVRSHTSPPIHTMLGSIESVLPQTMSRRLQLRVDRL